MYFNFSVYILFRIFFRSGIVTSSCQRLAWNIPQTRCCKLLVSDLFGSFPLNMYCVNILCFRLFGELEEQNKEETGVLSAVKVGDKLGVGIIHNKQEEPNQVFFTLNGIRQVIGN